MTRPSWDEYFIDLAWSISKRSKDPSTQVGCVIVDKEHRPVSFGYNGWIAGCDESYMTYERPMKYQLVLHAEMNSLLFADRDKLRGATLYCTHGPCANCLKHTLQSGITRIIFDEIGPIVRGTDEDKEAIIRLLQSMPNVICQSLDDTPYIELISRGTNR